MFARLAANFSIFEIGYFMRPRLTHHEAHEGHEGRKLILLISSLNFVIFVAFVVNFSLPTFAAFAPLREIFRISVAA